MRRLVGCCLVLLSALVPGCVPREPPEPLRPPPPPPPKVLYEEEVRPVERPDLSILDVNESRDKGSKVATVTGTIVNRGTGAAHDLTVTVEARDAGGATLLSVRAVPSAGRIVPGGTATFTATFERPPGTDEYHVEAVGR